ncbi:unnamed protein product [Parnassius apollo]|uniref:(apollo) hypothetical protein n=1 Tax=Parnassius apollo TaxID=110799 RepID=A0A8S3WTF8_PARAO|nr:unnamed protein product [Parnassius apollo]
MSGNCLIVFVIYFILVYVDAWRVFPLQNTSAVFYNQRIQPTPVLGYTWPKRNYSQGKPKVPENPFSEDQVLLYKILNYTSQLQKYHRDILEEHDKTSS